MNYASAEDLFARFSEAELYQLSAPDSSAVDPDRLDTKLADAQAAIDGWIGKRYRLPLRGCAKPAPVPGDAHAVQWVAPPQLTRIACDLARFWLRDAVAEESDVYRRYRAAMDELKAIANGDAQLACPWGGSAGELVGAYAHQEADQEVLHGFSPRVITDDGLRGF